MSMKLNKKESPRQGPSRPSPGPGVPGCQDHLFCEDLALRPMLDLLQLFDPMNLPEEVQNSCPATRRIQATRNVQIIFSYSMINLVLGTERRKTISFS